MVFGSLERNEEALAAFDEAILLNPQNANVWHEKGMVLESLERFEEAVVAYDESIRLNPQNANTFRRKGAILRKLGRKDEAIEANDESRKILGYSPNSSRLSSESGNREPLTDEQIETEVVILLQGNNLYGDQIYSYLKVNGMNLTDMFVEMRLGHNFRPTDFGTVLAAGRGKPTQEFHDEIKRK
jgi:tetratricopeptide (TPR) repeat protein